MNSPKIENLNFVLSMPSQTRPWLSSIKGTPNEYNVSIFNYYRDMIFLRFVNFSWLALCQWLCSFVCILLWMVIPAVGHSHVGSSFCCGEGRRLGMMKPIWRLLALISNKNTFKDKQVMCPLFYKVYFTIIGRKNLVYCETFKSLLALTCFECDTKLVMLQQQKNPMEYLE